MRMNAPATKVKPGYSCSSDHSAVSGPLASLTTSRRSVLPLRISLMAALPKIVMLKILKIRMLQRHIVLLLFPSI